MAHHKNILIPHIHHPHTFERMNREEEVRTTFENKFYIAPNRQSRPLGLPPKNLTNQTHERFHPSFDHFNLSSMFSDKKLTEEQLNWFKNDKVELQILQTPTRKKTQNHALKQTQETKHGNSQAKKSRPKEKGLRQLSQRAYEIVLNLRSASYKQVANKLVDELNSEKQSEHNHPLRSRIQQKDQQNIKRRVYDALNVLIALGVLRKDGRKIVGDRSIEYKFDQAHKNSLSAQIQAKQQRLKSKLQQLKKERAKLQLIPQLIVSNERSMDEQGKKDRIQMPFMILDVDLNSLQEKQVDPQGNIQRIEIKKNKRQAMKMDLDCYTQYKLSSSLVR